MSSSIPQTPGIYKITCLPTGKIYIGGAVNLRKRWNEHRAALRARRHRSQYLQRAWNKYGESAFEFSIVELLMFAEDVLFREQHWLDQTHCSDPAIGYNSCRFAGVTTGIKHSEETRAKMRAAHAGKTKSADHVRNQADSNASEWLITQPDGERVCIRNLNAFCRERGLDQARMIRIANGQKKCKTHFGYRCVRLSPKRST